MYIAKKEKRLYNIIYPSTFDLDKKKILPQLNQERKKGRWETDEVSLLGQTDMQ